MGAPVVKLFSGRVSQLETMNRILTDSARQRAERVEQLERKLDIVEPQLQEARKRLKELEEAATERAARIQELENEIRELRIEYATKVQELENEIRELRIEYATKDFPRVEAEREFYRKRMTELDEHNRQLTEAATKYALRAQELERELSELDPNWNKKLPLS
jgi:chromosome segregation ATPase